MIQALTRIRHLSMSAAAKMQPHWFDPSAETTRVATRPVLRIYNSLTRKKNVFVPIKEGHVTWYCCGPTVYDHSHMGHARNYVSLDLCRRVMVDFFGYNVKFVQNVTDIDDKIIVAARQQYLFETKVLKPNAESVSQGLVDLANEAWNQYVSKNLSQYLGEPSAFVEWSKLLDMETEAKAHPKLPMHIKAACEARGALDSSAASMGSASYLEAIKQVMMPYLDSQYGSEVNDPQIFRALPAFWEQKFDADMAKLNVLSPTITTRVSEYVPEIVEYVAKIMLNGYAYATADGSVYFDTAKFDALPLHDYAKLQPWNKGNMELITDGEGSLSSTAEKKRSAADFALWKGSKPGEPHWPSPWGEGRPGWHIECSVMASDAGGEVLDIHSGGVDLCFPHHDNELAQLEAYFDSKQWVNYFMHNGHLHIHGQKMSKSLKNFITIEEALQTYTSRQLRLVFALSPWEKPLDFKDSLIAEVKAYESGASKYFTTVRALYSDHKHKVAGGEMFSKKMGPADFQLLQDLEKAQDAVYAAFCDNLATGTALRALQDLIARAHTYIQQSLAGEFELRIDGLLDVTRYICKIFQILGLEARSDGLGWLDSSANKDSGLASVEDVASPYIKVFSQFRDSVRTMAIAKADLTEFLQATDSVRNLLAKLGVSLDDRPNGSALVKFLNDQEREELIQQQQDKERLANERDQRKQQQAMANAKKEEERQAKMRVNPADMFRDENLYSAWDEQGMPTVDKAGEEVSKSMRKKLAKQYAQQEKLYQEYLKQQA